MKTEDRPGSLQGTEEQTGLANVLKGWKEICENCHPLTPITCVVDCKIWKLKNEFRKLYERMKNPIFVTKLLNALKNKRRLQMLGIISKGRHSLARLQQELKKRGYYHSQRTIAEEYIAPLIEVGAAKEDQNYFHATVFGSRLNDLVENFYDVEEVLPPHSECYEEMVLNALLDGPKTYEDLEGVIPTKSVARVLKRLQKAGLINATKEKDHVFYFRTKRDSNRVKISPTEKRVYENISVEGISARKLSEKTEISLRRTYKYLRRLKRKKMVFVRKKPKSYSLTVRGFQLATILERVLNLVAGLLVVANQVSRAGEIQPLPTLEVYHIESGK